MKNPIIEKREKSSRAKSKGDKKLKASEAARFSDAIKLLSSKSSPLTFGKIADWFLKSGLNINDPAFRNIFADYRHDWGTPISINDFEAAFHLNSDLFSRLVSKKLAVPNFSAFCSQFSEIFDKTSKNVGGQVAGYIPQLAKVDPESFAAAFCSVDGQRFAIGDTHKEFCVQSCSKPITYSMVVEEHGLDYVHNHVGREPSGRGFSDFVFDYRGLPHNPMINSGAIMCSSMIKPQENLASRFEYVLDTWRELAGHMRIGYDNPTYLSEKASADRNFALGHFMRENKAFPKGTNLHEVIDLYFQMCSIAVSAEAMSVAAATLANGGVCPMTGHRVFKPETVRGCLSLMYSCGLYDYSGEFAFKIGMPAKSGVSGAMMLIVPNVMGLCIWSPRLDRLGNSVRALEFCNAVQEQFHFHIFDQLVPGLSLNSSGGQKNGMSRAELIDISDLCYAAANGDVDYLKRLVAKGVDCTLGDYDGRTPLHLAAAEGQLAAVKYLIDNGARLDAVDRFGITPLSEGKRCKNKKVSQFFKSLNINS